MALLYDEHLVDTIIYENTDLSGNMIMEIRDLVLSYLQIGLHTSNEKYRISPSKIEMYTNTTLHNNTERIDSCKVLEVTDDEGEIH